MTNIEQHRVVARSEDLLREEVGDDLVIYDLTSDTAHLLNESARRVFEAASVNSSIGELCELFPEAPADQRLDIVVMAVDQLREQNLIYSLELPGLSRRQLLKRMAVAAVAAPAVVSILAPAAPVAAGTGGGCVAQQASCTIGATGAGACCTGNTCTNTSGSGDRCCVNGSGNNTKIAGGQCNGNADCCSGSCNTTAKTCN